MMQTWETPWDILKQSQGIGALREAHRAHLWSNRPNQINQSCLGVRNSINISDILQDAFRLFRSGTLKARSLAATDCAQAILKVSKWAQQNFVRNLKPQLLTEFDRGMQQSFASSNSIQTQHAGRPQRIFGRVIPVNIVDVQPILTYRRSANVNRTTSPAPGTWGLNNAYSKAAKSPSHTESHTESFWLAQGDGNSLAVVVSINDVVKRKQTRINSDGDGDGDGVGSRILDVCDKTVLW